MARRYRDRGHEVIVAGRKSSDSIIEIDLATDQGVKFDMPHGVNLAIVAAGLTGFSAVARDPERSHAINVTNMQSLLTRICTQCPCMYISTSAVFDGSVAYPDEAALPSPQSLYAQQKYCVENFLLDRYEESAIVVRLTKVIHQQLELVEHWKVALIKGRRVNPFSDLVVSPISREYLSHALLSIASAGARGVLHLSGQRDLSYADLCEYFCKLWKCSPELISSIPSHVRADSLALCKFAALGMQRSAALGISPCPLDGSAFE